MKIYTRTGDQGNTTLIGGEKIQKHHNRIEAYGTIDELIANLGMIRALCSYEHMIYELNRIQDILMVCCSVIADKHNLKNFDRLLNPEEILFLEDSIDRMTQELPVLNNFILPAGPQVAAQCHIARTVCRRAERNVLRINETEEIHQAIYMYLNRLADYLFVLSRWFVHKLNFSEILWKVNL
jgi:cob(I)alamin adenosyltransferase